LIYLAQRQDFTKKAKLKFFTKAFVVLAGSLVKSAKKNLPRFFCACFLLRSVEHATISALAAETPPAF